MANITSENIHYSVTMDARENNKKYWISNKLKYVTIKYAPEVTKVKNSVFERNLFANNFFFVLEHTAKEIPSIYYRA